MQDETRTPLPRGWPEKRRAITRAARTVFGRDGYARASIDAIAAEAGASTRTIYNHFGGKEQLFSFVIQESATQVADNLTRLIQQHLGHVTDLEADLIALGRSWATLVAEFADHFAMVRQIYAEAPHFPSAALQTWQEAGPVRVDHELTRHVEQLAEQGLLHVDDARQAANHFLLLTAGEINDRSYFGAVPLDDAEVAQIVTAGVRAFLYGYLPRPPAE